MREGGPPPSSQLIMGKKVHTPQPQYSRGLAAPLNLGDGANPNPAPPPSSPHHETMLWGLGTPSPGP